MQIGELGEYRHETGTYILCEDCASDDGGTLKGDLAPVRWLTATAGRCDDCLEVVNQLEANAMTTRYQFTEREFPTYG